jgi:hypothetical protein
MKIKTIPSYPANILGGAGIEVTKASGHVTVDLAHGEFATQTAIPTSPTNTVLTYDTATGTYVNIPSSLLGGAVAGISDAPINSKMYGRYNANWVDAWASPILTGNPTAPTPAALDNDTSIATTAFVTAAINSSGSFIQVGSGAVTRGMQDKARDIFSARDFGALGNGIADDTAAIQAAINAATAAGGGDVFIPHGVYVVSSTLNMPSPGRVTLRGAGSQATTLTTSNPTLGFVNVTGHYSQIRGITFTCSAVPTGGITINLGDAFSHTLEDILILNCWVGIAWQGISDSARISIGFATHIKIYNWQNTAINLEHANDIFITNFLFYQKDLVPQQLGQFGITMSNNCEAIVLQNGDVVGGQYGFVFASGSPTTVGARPGYNRITNVYFDSNAKGCVINSCVETVFTGVWFAGGRDGGGNAGLFINGGHGLHFIGCIWFSNGGIGCKISALAKDVIFISPSFSDNCAPGSSPPGTLDGLMLEDNCDGIQVVGGHSHNSEYGGKQAYGIRVGAGITNCTISGFDVRGNLIGGMALGTALSTTFTVTNCKGFITEARGEGAIPNGSPNVTINHGLSGIPVTVAGIAEWRCFQSSSSKRWFRFRRTSTAAPASR